MAQARYFAGASGRIYLYARDASYRCPYADEVYRPAGSALVVPRPYSDALVDALAVVANPPNVSILLRHAHRYAHRSELMGDRGVCPGCGARMEKIGYRTWIEAPVEEVTKLLERTSSETTVRLNQRLGATHLIVPGSFRYWPTKREAIAWAREEAEIDRASAREEVPT